MDEEIVEEERSADEAGEHGNAVVVDVDDPWVKYMEAKLALKSKHWNPSHPFTICRVPRDIRSVDNVAHDPLMVSIGPYHRGNPSLHEMEEVKWRNLNKIRHRAGNNFKDYLKEMKKIEPEARACYSGNINMAADEFIEMMLLDGLFIIEFFWTGLTGTEFLESPIRQLYRIDLDRIDEEEPTIYTIRGILCRFGRDMLLLENQLPFFVLERLWSLTYQRIEFYQWKKDCIDILYSSLPFEHEWDLNLDRVISKKGEDGVHHLLHLANLLLKPTSLTRTKKINPMESKPRTFMKKKKTLSFLPTRCRDCFRSPSGQESQSLKIIKKIHEQPRPLKVIPSAVELEGAGVVFKCVEAESFLDVKFEHGRMKMPRLSVQDSTKSLLRNFIAYEQCFPSQGSHITSYCSFMDQLVNTPRDVEILKKSKIMENWLGSDQEVALLFNDLCKGTCALDFTESYLAESFEQVTKHTQKTWPKWRAKLKHDYFSNPWAIISLIAATFVIFLTSVQAYYAARHSPDLAVSTHTAVLILSY